MFRFRVPRRIRSQYFYFSISSVSVRYDGSIPTRALLNGSGTAKVVAIKKKKALERLNPVTPSEASLLYVIYRMNAPRPPRIPKCERVQHAGLRSEEEQACERVDTNDWVNFVSFVSSFYFLDPCDHFKKWLRTGTHGTCPRSAPEEMWDTLVNSTSI